MTAKMLQKCSGNLSRTWANAMCINCAHWTLCAKTYSLILTLALSLLSIAGSAYAGGFSLNGTSTEIKGLTNGSVVQPASAPSGLTGSVVVKGKGSVAFSSVVSGAGV